LPLNSSISATLSCQDLFSETKVVFTNSDNVKSDIFRLNNKFLFKLGLIILFREDYITPRISNILNYFRENAKELGDENNFIN